MKFRLFFLSLLAITVIFGMVIPNGIRAAAANNAWSLTFIREAAQMESTTPQDFTTPPPSHRHAGMLLAHQALKLDDTDLAWSYLAPLLSEPDLLIRETQANINYLQGEFENAIYIWKALGHYSTLYTAASRLSDEDHLDAKILAYRSAYDIRGEPYARLVTYNSLQKANLLIDEGQYDQAIAILSPLIDEFPHHGWLYDGLARAYWLDHQPDLAVKVMEGGWDANSDNPRFHIIAAYYYEELGLTEKALEAYKTALAINPEHHDALQGIQRLTGADE
ncbi:MAG: tetratricopeptide repeat protein [Anaerolineaceae bacterium]|nr:tetratricopeptide repeat protein [Anaerolineaceae bacterium]